MTQHVQALALRHSSQFKEHVMSIGHTLYGTKERTWVTLSITFALLVLSISMMQAAQTGGACSVTGM